MTHMLIELYAPKAAWHALDASGRTAFFARIGAGMEALTALGVETVAFGEIDADLPHASPYRFFALWRVPGADALRALADGIAASGWHDYFDTINAAGRTVGMTDHLDQLARL